ncbi:MAG: hypothetical protein ACTSQG_03405 [Promethearchaeota archaeon]
MEVIDKLKYKQYRERKAKWNNFQSFFYDIFLPCIIFGSIGAMTWAIRGTSGWGGFDGALIPGFAWGLLWFYLMYRRGIDGRAVCFWLGLGIALGGMLGYGQYISWIQGRFYVNGPNKTFDINPLIGYIWLMICGVAWGGVAGIFLGWVLSEQVSLKQWIIRIFVPLIFVGVSVLIIIYLPSLVFPYYSKELYTELNCPDCSRTYSTNLLNFIVFMWWIGALIAGIIEKNKKMVIYGTVMGVGFGIVFSLSAIWTLGYIWAPNYIDWWKMWELTIGLGGGIIIALVLYLAQKNINKKYDINGKPLKLYSQSKDNAMPDKKRKKKKLFLLHDKNLRNQFLLIFSFSLLLFISYYGLTYNLGIFLGLYDSELVDQYDLTVERLILVIPALIMFIGFLLIKYIKLCQISKHQNNSIIFIENSFMKMIHIFCFITLTGVISIWPSKILVFYIICLWFSLYSLILLDNILPYNYNINEKDESILDN